MTAITLRLACTFRLMSIQRLLLLPLLLPVLCPTGLRLKARHSYRSIGIRKPNAKNRVKVALSTVHPILVVLHLYLRKRLLKVCVTGLSGRAVCGYGATENVGSSPAKGMDVCLL